jgi:hypothetical protein
MGVKTYDPAEVSLIVGGKIITGFTDGTGITVERNEDLWNLKVGIDGEGARSKNNNRSGKFTIALQQTADSNNDLSTFEQADELTNGGAVPVFLRDANGSTIATCTTAWVKKLPNSEYAKEITARTWVLETDFLEYFVGGN